MAHVSTHHDRRLIIEDGTSVAWPDGQPRIDRKGPIFLPKKFSYNIFLQHLNPQKTNNFSVVLTFYCNNFFGLQHQEDVSKAVVT